MDKKPVYEQTLQAVRELLAENRPHFNPVRLLAVGGSSSEIAGGTIGHDSAYELGEAAAEAVLEACGEAGVDAAFQCCEHLNRALVMERAAAEARGYEIVCVVPQPKAGGSLATAAWKAMKDPVAVLNISADAATPRPASTTRTSPAFACATPTRTARSSTSISHRPPCPRTLPPSA